LVLFIFLFASMTWAQDSGGLKDHVADYLSQRLYDLSSSTGPQATFWRDILKKLDPDAKPNPQCQKFTMEDYAKLGVNPEISPMKIDLECTKKIGIQPLFILSDDILRSMAEKFFFDKFYENQVKEIGCEMVFLKSYGHSKDSDLSEFKKKYKNLNKVAANVFGSKIESNSGDFSSNDSDIRNTAKYLANVVRLTREIEKMGRELLAQTYGLRGAAYRNLEEDPHRKELKKEIEIETIELNMNYSLIWNIENGGMKDLVANYIADENFKPEDLNLEKNQIVFQDRAIDAATKEVLSRTKQDQEILLRRTTDGYTRRDLVNMANQEMHIDFWNMLATRYKKGDPGLNDRWSDETMALEKLVCPINARYGTGSKMLHDMTLAVGFGITTGPGIAFVSVGALILAAQALDDCTTHPANYTHYDRGYCQKDDLLSKGEVNPKDSEFRKCAEAILNASLAMPLHELKILKPIGK